MIQVRVQQIIELAACLPFACAKHTPSVGLYEIPYQDNKVQSSPFIWDKGWYPVEYVGLSRRSECIWAAVISELGQLAGLKFLFQEKNVS